MRRPAPLKALTGLRCFAAVNIVLFHFSNPQWFGWLAPVVNAGFISVSYFILLSGFVLAYNYSERARAGELDRVRFWKARFTRIYPIYLLSLLLGLGTLSKEYGSHTHGMFWAGVVLTPLLLQGWIPAIATFLNTPAWTMSAEAFYYAIFPWLARWKRPERLGPHLMRMALAYGCWGSFPARCIWRSILTGSRILTAGVSVTGCGRSNIPPMHMWPALSSESCWPMWTG